MQGLSMVSRDGKHFYWVIFKIPASQEQCVIAYLFTDGPFISQASFKQGIIGIFVFQQFCMEFYLFCMTTNKPILKSFQLIQWKDILAWCFSSF